MLSMIHKTSKHSIHFLYIIWALNRTIELGSYFELLHRPFLMLSCFFLSKRLGFFTHFQLFYHFGFFFVKTSIPIWTTKRFIIMIFPKPANQYWVYSSIYDIFSESQEPEEKDFISTNSSCINLQLSLWNNGGCSISHFSIEHRPHGKL